MRTVLRQAQSQEPHPGLRAERYAAIDLVRGVLSDEKKPEHVRLLTEQRVPEVYGWAYQRWRQMVSRVCWTAEVSTRSRLLIGVGNPSPLENGLTLHHTYGVPYLPATALKGVLNHWLAERFGRAGAV